MRLDKPRTKGLLTASLKYGLGLRSRAQARSTSNLNLHLRLSAGSETKLATYGWPSMSSPGQEQLARLRPKNVRMMRTDVEEPILWTHRVLNGWNWLFCRLHSYIFCQGYQVGSNQLRNWNGLKIWLLQHVIDDYLDGNFHPADADSSFARGASGKWLRWLKRLVGHCY